MYLINLETDGDGVYHVHKRTCKHRPNSNYRYLSSIRLVDAINEGRKTVHSNITLFI